MDRTEGLRAIILMALLLLVAGYLAKGQDVPQHLQVLLANVIGAGLVIGTRRS